MEFPVTDELLTVDQAAARLNMSARYVRRLVSERRIAFVRLGRSVRIKESDITLLIEAGCVSPITASDVWRDLRGVA